MNRSKTILFSMITGILILGFGFFFTSKWWGGDDSLIRNTWETGYFYDVSYRVSLERVTYDLSQHELFFVVNQSKVDTTKILKLQVDVIGKDDYLYPVQTFSHLENETLLDTKQKQTVYSFSMPLEDWRYIRFIIQTEAADGSLSNQTVLYADYRSVETSDTPLTLMDFLTTETTDSEDESLASTEEETTSETNDSQSDVSDSPTQDEPLKQQYVIESEPIILDGGESHQHEGSESDEPIYSLADYEHQEQKLTTEIAQVQTQLEKETDNQTLKTQLSELQTQLKEVQEKIKNLK